MAHRQVLDGRHQAWCTAHANPTQPGGPVGCPSQPVPSTAAQAPRDPIHRPHQAVSAADGHSGLSAVLGQRVQARAGTATQNHGCGRGAGRCIVGLGSGRTKQWLVPSSQYRRRQNPPPAASDAVLPCCAAHPAPCWSASGCCPRAGCGTPAWRRPRCGGPCREGWAQAAGQAPGGCRCRRRRRQAGRLGTRPIVHIPCTLQQGSRGGAPGAREGPAPAQPLAAHRCASRWALAARLAVALAGS